MSETYTYVCELHSNYCKPSLFIKHSENLKEIQNTSRLMVINKFGEEWCFFRNIEKDIDIYCEEIFGVIRIDNDTYDICITKVHNPKSYKYSLKNFEEWVKENIIQI